MNVNIWLIKVNLTYPEEFSENLKSFLGGLIQKNPEERMSIEEVLGHGFLKNVKLSEWADLLGIMARGVIAGLRERRWEYQI